MFKLVINYPSGEEEASVLAMHSTQVESGPAGWASCKR